MVQMSNTRVPLEPKFIDKVHWEQLGSYTLSIDNINLYQHTHTSYEFESLAFDTVNWEQHNVIHKY